MSTLVVPACVMFCADMHAECTPAVGEPGDLHQVVASLGAHPVECHSVLWGHGPAAVAAFGAPHAARQASFHQGPASAFTGAEPPRTCIGEALTRVCFVVVATRGYCRYKLTPEANAEYERRQMAQAAGHAPEVPETKTGRDAGVGVNFPGGGVADSRPVMM